MRPPGEARSGTSSNMIRRAVRLIVRYVALGVATSVLIAWGAGAAPRGANLGNGCMAWGSEAGAWVIDRSVEHFADRFRMIRAVRGSASISGPTGSATSTLGPNDVVTAAAGDPFAELEKSPDYPIPARWTGLRGAMADDEREWVVA